MKERRHEVTFLFVMFIHLYFIHLLGGIIGPCFWVGEGKAKLLPPTLISN